MEIDESDERKEAERKPTIDQSELPFLVTHWLSNYQPQQNTEAARRLRDAAAEVASAFSDLGVFGTTNKPVFQSRYRFQETSNATYQDLRRAFAQIQPTHLESLAFASASLAAVTSDRPNESPNLLQQVLETRPDLAGGRRLNEAMIDLTGDRTVEQMGGSPQVPLSLFLPPPLVAIKEAVPATGFAVDTAQEEQKVKRGKKPANPDYKPLQVPIELECTRMAELSGRAMRNLLEAREKHREEENEIATLQKSLRHQTQQKQELAFRRKELEVEARQKGFTGSILEGSTAMTVKLDEIQESQNNCDRVLAQIGNRLSQLTATHRRTAEKLVRMEITARTTYTECAQKATRYRDPFSQVRRSSFTETVFDGKFSKNRLPVDLFVRQSGVSTARSQLGRRQIGRPPSRVSASEVQKSLFASRFSHAVTFSAHLTCPIYCLQFDKTGRYFVTGADDTLVKLFYIGPDRSRVLRSGEKTFSYGANARTPVLVCTLRGHAGVICDMDISADNALLATASDDGDVRVWGLKDGCPVAILRGHGGGAGMVSWSLLTPFRLITTGMDGMSRIWDVREAAIKRYGSHIGARPEYVLQLTETEKQKDQMIKTIASSEASNDESENVTLPPIPRRLGPEDAETDQPSAPVDPAVVVALPQGEQVGVNDQQENGAAANQGQNIETGRFVFNDMLDEGVKIIAKHAHGDLQQQQQQEQAGPGTRSRRKLVKVICVARCPTGGFFATGSDDGLCLIWEDEDDDRVRIVDGRTTSTTEFPRRRGFSRSRLNPPDVSVPSKQRLLGTLQGHMAPITDLHYSNRGDRILTASQKEGSARIWSWPAATGRSDLTKEALKAVFSEKKQIILRLSGGMGRISSSSSRRRRGNNRGGSSADGGKSVSCDVAIWTSDDTKVVTSQSCPKSEANLEDMLPGSQFVLVWDSWTGQCLLSIGNGHTMPCPVLVTHPFEASLLCTAGLDGQAKLWDLESGVCLFSHENKIEFGPVGPKKERGDNSGYIDGAFNSDGLVLVLTDDSGRISLFDCLQSPLEPPRQEFQAWRREQYFGNDYYELFYDTNGYCVERGSEQPPHLAPRSARCNHSGSAWSEEISETYLKLRGPSPVSIESARESRVETLKKMCSPPSITLQSVVGQRRGTIIAEFNSNHTIQIHASPVDQHILAVQQSDSSGLVPAAAALAPRADTTERRRTGSSRSLSSNYRWRDYDDMIQQEGLGDDDGDPDDEEFVLGRRDSTREDDDLSDGYVHDNQWEDSSTEAPRSRNRSRSRNRRSGNANARALRVRRRENERQERDRQSADRRAEEANATSTRASRRQQEARERQPTDTPDSDEEMMEYMSSNNTPSGAFAHDYGDDGHFFKLPHHDSKVERKWLRRLENSSSYSGIKVYAPQVGDSVVYIPKAHASVIHDYMTLEAPWQNWPEGTHWPLVRCKIRNLRYRFPFKNYYRKRPNEDKPTSRSVVAIATLEVTGLPELSDEREYPWPRPSFVELSSSNAHMFEVSLFDSGHAEFVVPEALFLWRLRYLEEAVQKVSSPVGLSVGAYYNDANGGDEPMQTSMARIVQFRAGDDSTGHLGNSGFESVVVEWQVEGGRDSLSPWELTVEEQIFSPPNAPSLDTKEKRAVDAALRAIESNPEYGLFKEPVNLARYYDYEARIEVPMDLGFVRRRLDSGYYSSVHSVISDIKTIRDNCAKYNGEDDDLWFVADAMYDEFLTIMMEKLSGFGISVVGIKKLNDEDFLHACSANVRAGSSQAVSSAAPQPPERSLDGRPSGAASAVGNRSSTRIRLRVHNERASSQRSENDAPAARRSHRLNRSQISSEEGQSEMEANFDEEAESEVDEESDKKLSRPPRTSLAGVVQENLEVAPRQTRRSTRNRLSSRRTDLGAKEDDSNFESGSLGAEMLTRGSKSRGLSSLETTDEGERQRRRSARRSVLVDSTELPSRQSQRPKARRGASYEEVPSDVDEADAESENRAESEDEGQRGRPTRRLSQPRSSAPPSRHSRRSQSRKDTSYEEVASDMDEADAESEGEGQRIYSTRSQRSTEPPSRSSRRSQSRKAASYKEVASDIDEADAEPDRHATTENENQRRSTRRLSQLVSPARRSRRTNPRMATSHAATVSNRNEVDEESEYDTAEEEIGRQRNSPRRPVPQRSPVSPARPSRRSKRTASTAYEEVASDYDESDAERDEEEEDLEEEVVEPPRKKHRANQGSGRAAVRRNKGAVKQSARRAASGRGKKRKTDDYDSDEAEFSDESSSADEVYDESSDDEVVTSGRRRRDADSLAPALKETGPSLEEWPLIDIKKITKVTKEVLKAMRELDEQELFWVPVVETNPQLKKQYAKKIDRPLDFRTIEEEEMQQYQEISELQYDLELIFRNCVTFNGVKTEYGQYAIALWEQINHVFENVCKRLKIRLPADWK